MTLEGLYNCRHCFAVVVSVTEVKTMLLSCDYRAFRIVKMPKVSESTKLMDRESNLVVISAFLALNVTMACIFDLYKK